MNIQIRDTRGWDKSDPFGLPIIGVLDTFEREGVLICDMRKRKLIGDYNLALTANLDYFSFLLVPSINKYRREFLSDVSSTTRVLDITDNKYLGFFFHIESLFKTMITITELLEKFVKEIMIYLDIYNNYPVVERSRGGRRMTFSKEQSLIIRILCRNKLAPFHWYDFVNGLRNFVSHEGALTPYYSDGSNITFYKKRWDKRKKVDMKKIVKYSNAFVRIRTALRKELSDREYMSKLVRDYR